MLRTESDAIEYFRPVEPDTLIKAKGESAMPTASARHILVESEAQCLEIKNEIESGVDFGTAAKKYSTCPSRMQGGELGSFRPGQMVKEFDDVVFSGEINTVLGPVKTQFGYHLVEVTNRW